MNETLAVLPDRAALSIAFWSSPDDAMHAPEVVEAATGVKESTLAAYRVSGGGPKYSKRGKYVWYRKAAVVEWMRQLGEVSSSSEFDHVKAAA